ncbi:MAG: DUF4404 family protein [Planctomycetes bacterium]|nr:DUF4404 family protein [Planctomycetota bacterium]
MKDTKLSEALEELRQEINSSDISKEATRERLNRLISDLEERVAASADGDSDHGLMESIKESIGHLELEYPRTTSILNQILSTLGGAGI